MKQKRVIALAAIAVAAVLLGRLYLFLERGMPDNAEAQFRQYLAYRHPLAPLPVNRRVSHATRPWLFKADKSGASYSDAIYYRTTVKYGIVSAQQVSERSTAQAKGGAVWIGDGQRALPFPPEDTWCVRLDLGQKDPAVVLVALHQDLYNAAWVVHELPATWSAADYAGFVTEVGCAITFEK